MFKPDATYFNAFASEETLKRIVDYPSVSAMWEHSIQCYREHAAIQSPEGKLSYGELEEQVSLLRAALLEAGIKRGDRVAVYMPNSMDFVRSFLAITTVGAVAVLLPAHLDARALYGCSLQYALAAVIYAEGMEERLALLKDKSPVLLLTAKARGTKPVPPAQVEANQPCAILFTSGTTGKNKGSVLSNGAVMRGAKNGCYGYEEVFEQRYLLVLPLTHVFGLIRNLLTALYTGSSLFICMDNRDMFRNIGEFKPTILVLVPALAEMALNLSKKLKRNMLGEALKYIICGAAFVPPYLIREYRQLGITLFPGYGLTESANLVSGNPECLQKPDSVGYIYPDMEVRIVEGELWLKGANMQEGYFNDPEANAAAYEDGWFKTGDLVRMDEDGYLYITGRTKELIVLPSGENVSPAELEAVFSTVDAIADCLVFEDDKGRLLLEVLIRDSVVAAEGIEDPKGYIREQVFKLNHDFPTYMRVQDVRFRDRDFVRSPSMKIVRSKNGNVKE